MSILDIDVASIAQWLRVRQKLQGPTLLFLGARAGALFHSQTFYDILTPSPPPLDQTEKFQSCVRLLEQERFSDTTTHSILSRSLQDSFIHVIYRYVAPLAKYGFCQLIVTTNIDLGLEEALSQVGSRINNDFEVFIPDAHSDRSVPPLSPKYADDEPPSFRLVKLYGELALNRYSIKRREKRFAGDVPLYHKLQTMQNWNILMVGFDPVWDAAIVNILFPCAGKLWYVNEETPSHDSKVFEYLQSPNVQCLLGEKEGSSANFFQSLYRYIFGSTPLPSLAPQVETPSTQSSQSALPLSLEKVEQQIDRVKPPLTTQYKVDVLLLATTERELTALLNQPFVNMTRDTTTQGRTYYNCGTVGDASVFLMQADALDTLGKHILELSPACIIILGMAWGFNYKGQGIGNILIPNRIRIYDAEQEDRNSILAKKSGTDSHLQIGRHQKVVPPRPLNLFKNGSIILNKKTRRLVPITFGSLFASSQAIDEQDQQERQTVFRSVSRVAHDAIGIETGSATLFSLAQSNQNNCLLVKVVSGLVDVNETTDQEVLKGALEKAAQFILDVIVLGGFHDFQAQ